MNSKSIRRLLQNIARSGTRNPAVAFATGDERHTPLMTDNGWPEPGSHWSSR